MQLYTCIEFQDKMLHSLPLMTQFVHADSGLVHIPVSEAGLCVTHWASRSRFAASYILLTFSTVC